MLFRKNIFDKKHKNEEVYSSFTTDYMKVICASEIADMKEPPFNQSKWSSEEEYRIYLVSVQPLIEEYEKNGEIPQITLDDEVEHPEKVKKIKQFKDSFLHFSSYIDVEKMIDGKYRVHNNGRHRMYVAKKYGLKLIVHVAQEQENNKNDANQTCS